MDSGLKIFWIVALSTLLALSAVAEDESCVSLVSQFVRGLEFPADATTSRHSAELNFGYQEWTFLAPALESGVVEARVYTTFSLAANRCVVVTGAKQLLESSQTQTLPVAAEDICSKLIQSYANQIGHAGETELRSRLADGFERWQLGTALVLVKRQGLQCQIVSWSR